jgi:hypothetical protein
VRQDRERTTAKLQVVNVALEDDRIDGADVVD